MVRKGVHDSLPSTLVEQAGDLPGNEELGDRNERIEERTDTEHDQQNLEDLPARGLGRRDRPNGCDRVERPDEANPERGVLGERKADHSGDEEQTDRHAELRKAAQEEWKLPRLLAYSGFRGSPPDLSNPEPRGADHPFLVVGDAAVARGAGGPD